MMCLDYMYGKFGLGDCSFDNLLWNVFWMIRSLTVNIDSKINHRASILHYMFAIICFFCYLYSYLFNMVYNLGYVYPVTKNTTAAVVIVSLGFCSEIATMKLIYIIALRKELMNIVDEYRIVDQSVNTDSRYAKTALKELRAVKRRSLIFWLSFVSFSCVYLLLPGFMPGHNMPENNLLLYGLEPMFETPNYEIAYTCIVLAGVMATSVPANVTVLLIVLVGYIEAHMLSLTNEIRCLWTDTKITMNLPEDLRGQIQTQAQWNNFVRDRLNFIVGRHGKLLILLQKIRILFRGMLACEFTLTMIALCAVMLGGLEDFYLQIPYTIIQLMVDSLVGQRVLDAGWLFQESVYNCGWENFNAPNMKTVQVLLQCSQKDLVLTAGDITTLSFVSFSNIIKSVYSAYATLRNSMKKN